GLDEPLAKVVASSVQLSQYEKRDVTEAQVRHLFDNAPDQVRAALRPYGYFDAHVEGDIRQAGDDWVVTLDVDTGEPVKVTRLGIDLPDVATDLRTVRFAVRRFKPAKGQVLNQGLYTESRDGISAALIAA